jgi:hypothetical protein
MIEAQHRRDGKGGVLGARVDKSYRQHVAVSKRQVRLNLLDAREVHVRNIEGSLKQMF